MLALFSYGRFFSPADKRMSKIRNIGPVSMQWLVDVGVESIEELERIGSVEAYRRVRDLHQGEASLNLLWALQAGLMDIHWADLPPEIKDQLLAELDEQSG